MTRKPTGSTLAVVAGLVAVLLAVATNVATNSLPEAWRPYLWIAWPAVALLTVVGIALAIRQQHIGAHQQTPPASGGGQRQRSQSPAGAQPPGSMPVPAWLALPATHPVSPPVETRRQELPLTELRWEDFERLCLRLARLEGEVEHCQLYGVPGQAQRGIDLFARHRGAGTYTVYQCKRVEQFGPAAIRAAAGRFLEGQWANRASRFVLCTTATMVRTQHAEAIEEQAQRLAEHDVAFVVWDAPHISGLLKQQPNLVDDFFGRAWVAAFNGQPAAEQLGRRLDVGAVVAYRVRLAKFYRAVFNQHDPGVPVPPQPGAPAIPLGERFIRPDLYAEASEAPHPSSTVDAPLEPPDGGTSAVDAAVLRAPALPGAPLAGQGRPRTARPATQVYRPREDADVWLAKTERSIILGGPGSGKSCLLRYLVLDLLSDSPTLHQVAGRWGQRLPVWLPFAYWTKLIEQQTGGKCSIEECLQQWFAQWNQSQLWPLVAQAIADQRLLLIVDGLDEWASEAAGRVASQLLQVFAQTHRVAVVVTSRPSGFHRIPIHGEGWQVGELAGLSAEQQRQLCTKWFAIKASVDEGGRALSSDETDRVRGQADRFLQELAAAAAGVDDLAEVPLLLVFLLYLRFQQAVLPRRRFEAYERLVEHLVRDHPAARRSAALLTDPADGLGDREILDVLAGLAYTIHERHPDGIITEDQAAQVVADLLTATDDLGLGLTVAEARSYMPRFVSIAEGTLGVLVRQGVNELSFFHRSLQESLAARHLARKPLAEQRELVARHAADPRWREVLLGVFWRTTRADDLTQLLDRLRSQPGAGRFTVAELRAEVAFGEFNCGVALARAIAAETFQRIEQEAWMPHRERLLAHVLDGLRSTKTRELARDRVRRWTYDRRIWPAVLGPFARWPRCDEALRVLWAAMHDESPEVQRAAGRSLAVVARGHGETGAALATMARRSLDPFGRAAALECLRTGWPGHPGLAAAITAARDAESPELRIAAIAARIDLGAHDQADLDELLTVTSNRRGSELEFAWLQEAPRLLACGWPGSERLRDACLAAAREERSPSAFRGDAIDRDAAVEILLTGFPQDQLVAAWCVEELTSRYPFSLLHHSTQDWRWLGQNFRDHPDVVAAIDTWAPRQHIYQPQVALAALVGRTPIMKRTLLAALTEPSPQWTAASLLEGWGMRDPEVAAALAGMARGPAGPASAIAHLIPQILAGGAEGRSRLLELLTDPASTRHDLIVRGLADLPDRGDEAGIVDAVLAVLDHVDEQQLDRRQVEGMLITGFPTHPRVRQLAVERLAARNPPVGEAAWAYPADADMRVRVAALLTPLPRPLRGQILRELPRAGDDGGFALAILGDYDVEDDPELKVLASIGYHRLLPARGPVAEAAVERLRSMIATYGLYYIERRQAALAGLVVLRRLDVMAGAVETNGDPRPVAIPYSGLPNRSLLRLIAEHWELFPAAFGAELADRLSRGGDWTAAQFWAELAGVAAEFPPLHDHMLDALDAHDDAALDPSALRFLATIRPGTPLLRDRCLTVLTQGDRLGSGLSLEQLIVAADLLGSGFSDDPEVVNWLTSHSRPSLHDDGLIVALCAGWPQHPLLDELYAQLQAPGRPPVRISYAALYALTYTKLAAEQLPAQLERDLRRGETARRPPPGTLARPLIQRTRRDPDVQAVLADLLQPDLYCSGKASLPRVLATACGLSPALASWCNEELTRQLIPTNTPQLGFDLLASQVRAVALSLLDVLEASQ